MNSDEQSLTFKSLFFPFTTKKAFVFIFIIGIIIFFSSLFNGFVGDDSALLTENPTVQNILNLPLFFTSSTFYNGAGQKLSGPFYRPLQTSFFSVIHFLFGLNPTAFHFFQILLFIVDACLVFLLFKQFFRKELAFILSLIFLIHPINSEAAFYISVAQEPLFLFFGLISLLILKNFDSQKSLIFACLFLFLSLLSKEAGILFMISSGVFVFIFRKKDFLHFLGYSSLTFIIYLALRINAIGIFAKVTQNAPIEKMNLLERLVNAPQIFLFYLKTFVFPLNLAVIYQWLVIKIDLPNFFLPLLIDISILTTICVLGVYIYRHFPKKYYLTYVFFAFWFLIGILLYLQIIPLDMTVSEQWFYFPIIGILGMIGILIEVSKINLKNSLIISVVIMVIVLLSLRTTIRSFDFKDSFTLVSHDIKFSKEAYGLEHELSHLYFMKGDLKNAKLHAEKSIMLYPYVFNYTDLGNAYFYSKEYKKAKDAYLKALQYGDNYVTYDNLAALAVNYGNDKENIVSIKKYLNKYPSGVRLWLYLAVLEYRSGDKNDAKLAVQNAKFFNNGLQGVDLIYATIMNDQPLNFKINAQ